MRTYLLRSSNHSITSNSQLSKQPTNCPEIRPFLTASLTSWREESPTESLEEGKTSYTGILTPLNSALLRHGESTTFSQGRRLRVRTTHRDRSVKTIGWKSCLTIHQPNTFPIWYATPRPRHTEHLNKQTSPPGELPIQCGPSATPPSTSNRNTREWNPSHHPQQWQTTSNNDNRGRPEPRTDNIQPPITP